MREAFLAWRKRLEDMDQGYSIDVSCRDCSGKKNACGRCNTELMANWAPPHESWSPSATLRVACSLQELVEREVHRA